MSAGVSARPTKAPDPVWWEDERQDRARYERWLEAADARQIEMARQAREMNTWIRESNTRHGTRISELTSACTTTGLDVRERQLIDLDARYATPEQIRFFETALCDRAAKAGVDVFWGATTRGGSAWRGLARIEVPRPTCEALFAVGLHEIGHVVAPDADHTVLRCASKPGARKVICPLGEVAAWRSAKASAGPLWGAKAQRECDRCLATYAPYATRAELAEFATVMSPEAVRRLMFPALAAREARLRALGIGRRAPSLALRLRQLQALGLSG